MKKLTAEWVRKAEADLAAAQRLRGHRPPLNDPVSFHCQQAAEKYLKAWLQENGLPLPKTHDLEKLLDDLLPHDATLGVFRAGLVRLTRYAVDYRYPGIHATSAQAQSAVRFAARFRDAIRQRLNIRSRPRKKTT